jgi:hypothetical protein
MLYWTAHVPFGGRDGGRANGRAQRPLAGSEALQACIMRRMMHRASRSGSRASDSALRRPPASLSPARGRRDDIRSVTLGRRCRGGQCTCLKGYSRRSSLLGARRSRALGDAARARGRAFLEPQWGGLLCAATQALGVDRENERGAHSNCARRRQHEKKMDRQGGAMAIGTTIILHLRPVVWDSGVQLLRQATELRWLTCQASTSPLTATVPCMSAFPQKVQKTGRRCQLALRR